MKKFKIKYKNLTQEVREKDTGGPRKGHGAGHGVEGKFFPPGIIIIIIIIILYYIILYYIILSTEKLTSNPVSLSVSFF